MPPPTYPTRWEWMEDPIERQVESDRRSIESSETIRGDHPMALDDPVPSNPRPSGQHALRNQPIASPTSILTEAFTMYNIKLKVGDTVELESETGDTRIFRDGDFLRIKEIFDDVNKGVYLRGWLFRRNSLIIGRPLPNLVNEVTMIIDQELDDAREPLVQGMRTVSINKVFKKRKLVLTNAAFPAHSFREHTVFHSNGPEAPIIREEIRNSSELVCRWISISIFENTTQRKNFYKGLGKMAPGETKVSTEGLVRRLRPNEVDPDVVVLDSMVLLEWIGYFPWQRDAAGRYKASRRAAADICCGAGFASLGLRQADFKVSWSLDMNADAVASYKLNHPETTVYTYDIGDFIHFVYTDEHHVEILHCSFPCQWFSPAHTREGANDEANTAAVFALRELLIRIKPRIVTFEQTSGFLTHHPVWLQAVTRMFTDIGYSVRWKKMNLAEHGIAHTRERLIIIASCPGSTLPPFPEPSYGPKGYYPYMTIAGALEPLNHVTPPILGHDPGNMIRRDGPRYDPNIQLQHTITTSGTTVLHPNGRRKFSICELVLLQGAPYDFKFARYLNLTEINKQCGNAFPTMPACAIFTRIYLALDEEDALMEAEEAAARDQGEQMQM